MHVLSDVLDFFQMWQIVWCSYSCDFNIVKW